MDGPGRDIGTGAREDAINRPRWSLVSLSPCPNSHAQLLVLIAQPQIIIYVFSMILSAYILLSV